MNATPNLTLWGVGTSRTIRPHWAMHELGLVYETKPIGPRTGETKTAEYTKLNPRQKIPLLQDGDFCIGESAAIVAYLSRTYSTTGTLADSGNHRASMPHGWNGASLSSPNWTPPAFTSCAAIAPTRWVRSTVLRPRSLPRPANIFANSCATSRWRLRTAGNS